MSGPRVLLMQLSERTSGKGNRYLSGWLGKASVVAFPGENDKHGNPTWDVFVSTPEPRPEDRKGERRASDVPAGRNGLFQQQPVPADRTGVCNSKASGDAPAKPSARPVERGADWRGPSAYRHRSLTVGRRAPAADGGAFHEDSLEDIGRG